LYQFWGRYFPWLGCFYDQSYESLGGLFYAHVITFSTSNELVEGKDHYSHAASFNTRKKPP